VDLEEILEDVPIGGPPGIKDGLDCLGVARMVGRMGWVENFACRVISDTAEDKLPG
jgi:hypothetical protein